MARPTTTVEASAAGTFGLGGELTVNRIGFGAMRLTGDGIWGEPDDPEAAKEVLRHAVALGVNLIDTADSYGPEVSERLIAEALHPYPPELVIATKGGLRRGGPGDWRRDARPERLREACEASLRRLELETIDLYQLHAPDPEVPFGDSVGALADLHWEGKVRLVGVSNVDRTQLDTARGIVNVVSVQNRYNLRDREDDGLVDHCEAEGIAFIPWYPLGAGPLAEPGSPLGRMAARKGSTPAQLALAWLLHRSRNVLPIPGTTSRAHLKENVAAAAIQLSDEEMEELTGLAAGR